MILKMRICFLVRSLLEKKKVLFVIRSRLSVSSSLAETCEKENVCSSSGAREKRKEKCFIRFTLSLKTKKVAGSENSLDGS